MSKVFAALLILEFSHNYDGPTKLI